MYDSDLFEQSLSTVYPIFKNNSAVFKKVIATILEAKYYNAKESIDKVFGLIESKTCEKE